MRVAVMLAAALVVSGSVTARAQESATAPAIEVGASEWMVTAGPAIGVTLFNSADGYRYVLQSLSWGRVLSRVRGPGVLRGHFQWSFEVVPIFGQFDPETTYGFGLTPIVWRWNFEPRGRVAPFAELAGGALWTRHPVPVGTTTGNFTAHVSYGIRFFVTPHTSVVASYRLHHISNGNRLDLNPGINAHVMQIGISRIY